MSELKIIATILVKPEYEEEIKKAMYIVVDETRKENGNISYDLYQNSKESLKYTFIEVWKSQEDIYAHNNSLHFKDFIKFLEGKYDHLEIDIVKKIY
jgi:quinol monooxygenase YgiN